MKKQDVTAAKLLFNKEKIASLTPDELDQVGGGETIFDGSTHHNFTCGLCTTLTGVEVQQ